VLPSASLVANCERAANVSTLGGGAGGSGTRKTSYGFR
jgi:hypothetical protein